MTMHISLRQEWTLAHILALALIMMAGFFAALVALPLPDVFLAYVLRSFFIVPYVLAKLPFASVVQDPHALPSLSPFFVWYPLVIYTFFFALALAFVGKKKAIPLSYIGLYIFCAFVFDMLFDPLL